jgi:hypothetical protein
MVTIKSTKIIGTTITVYSAYEPAAHGLPGAGWDHSTLTSEDGSDGFLGRIGTRRLPAELEALPAYSDERLAAVGAWQEAQYREAYALILAAHPEAIDGRRSMGEIEVYG